MHPRVVLAGLIVRQSFRLGDRDQEVATAGFPSVWNGSGLLPKYYLLSVTFTLWSFNTVPQASLTGETGAARDVALAAYSMRSALELCQATHRAPDGITHFRTLAF